MWFNLDDDDRKLITAIADGDLSDVNKIKLIALRSRLTDQETGQRDLQAYRDAVETSDELEVDADAIVSPGGDPGAFVMTWTWVSNEKAGIDEEEE
jgi:hypothetical protein